MSNTLGILFLALIVIVTSITVQNISKEIHELKREFDYFRFKADNHYRLTKTHTNAIMDNAKRLTILERNTNNDLQNETYGDVSKG